VISRDRYLKRDELGVIYQLCVAPGHQRGLIGASLVKAVFERSAYGCKLYCCWCAQDLAANYFWESLGFIPIAFRAGSTGKRRVHIFWQRRITNDATPWWYPCQTNGGAIRADRLVFPSPPGTHWKDVHAVAVVARAGEGEEKALPSDEPPVVKAKRERKPAVPVVAPRVIAAGGLRFAAPPPPPGAPNPEPQRVAKPKVKIDPRIVARARELRDRALEHFNGDAANDPLVLRATVAKYDVSRTLADPTSTSIPLLKAS
jgi:hypothetical protein